MVAVTRYAFTCIPQLLAMKEIPTSSRNPQSCTLWKCVHKTMAILLKTLLLFPLPEIPQDTLHLVDNILCTTMHVMSSTLQCSTQALTAFLFSECATQYTPHCGMTNHHSKLRIIDKWCPVKNQSTIHQLWLLCWKQSCHDKTKESFPSKPLAYVFTLVVASLFSSMLVL